MIKKYTLKLNKVSGMDFDERNVGHAFFSALLHLLPTEVAGYIHSLQYTPINNSLEKSGNELIWTVNVFRKEFITEVDIVFDSLEELEIKKYHSRFFVADIKTEYIDSMDELFAIARKDDTFTNLSFVSPTAFKSHEDYIAYPSIPFILMSLINKWNGIFPELQIEDTDGEGINALIDSIKIWDFDIKSVHTIVKGCKIPGFVGKITFRTTCEGFHKDLIDFLLKFGEFSGVGIKTSLGMGHLKIEKRRLNGMIEGK